MKKTILVGMVALLIVSSAIAQIQDDRTQVGKTPENKIQKISNKNPNEKVDIIVTLKEVAADENIDKVKKKIGDFKINEKGWSDVYPNGFSATVTREQMKKLLEDPSVERVDINEIQKWDLDTANKWSGSEKARRSTTSGGFGVDGDRTGNRYQYSNTDVVVAVIDTGIDPKHTDLTGLDNAGGTKKIIGWLDTIAGEPEPYDDIGHGTHVASIVAGEGDSDPKYKGVAPGAALVGVKVCNAGGCPMDKIITAVNWVVANKNTYGIKIIQMSISGVGASDGTDPESVAFNNAVNSGLVAVISAGNSGPVKYTISRPATAANVITVGAIADPGYITGELKTGLVDNGFYLAPFSSRGPTANNKIKPDVVAPGVAIMASANTYPNTPGFHGGYVEYDGTSMAAPFVSGVAALMFDANYTISASQAKNIIRATAEDYGVSGCDIDFGCGRVRAYRAVKMAKTGVNSGVGDQPVPTHKRYSAYINDTTDIKSYLTPITSTQYPYAATLIMKDWSGYVPYYLNYLPYEEAAIDLDAVIYNPSGAYVDWAATTERQDTIVIRPSGTGTFTTNVEKWLGSGYYTLDISYK